MGGYIWWNIKCLSALVKDVDFPFSPFPQTGFLFAYAIFQATWLFLLPQRHFRVLHAPKLGRESSYLGAFMCPFWCTCDTLGIIVSISRHYLVGSGAANVLRSLGLPLSNVYHMWQTNAELLLHIWKDSSLQWPKMSTRNCLENQFSRPVFAQLPWPEHQNLTE